MLHIITTFSVLLVQRNSMDTKKLRNYNLNRNEHISKKTFLKKVFKQQKNRPTKIIIT